MCRASKNRHRKWCSCCGLQTDVNVYLLRKGTIVSKDKACHNRGIEEGQNERGEGALAPRSSFTSFMITTCLLSRTLLNGWLKLCGLVPPVHASSNSLPKARNRSSNECSELKPCRGRRPPYKHFIFTDHTYTTAMQLYAYEPYDNVCSKMFDSELQERTRPLTTETMGPTALLSKRLAMTELEPRQTSFVAT